MEVIVRVLQGDLIEVILQHSGTIRQLNTTCLVLAIIGVILFFPIGLLYLLCLEYETQCVNCHNVVACE